jgi:hypothetical protein
MENDALTGPQSTRSPVSRAPTPATSAVELERRVAAGVAACAVPAAPAVTVPVTAVATSRRMAARLTM